MVSIQFKCGTALDVLPHRSKMLMVILLRPITPDHRVIKVVVVIMLQDEQPATDLLSITVPQIDWNYIQTSALAIGIRQCPNHHSNNRIGVNLNGLFMSSNRRNYIAAPGRWSNRPITSRRRDVKKVPLTTRVFHVGGGLIFQRQNVSDLAREPQISECDTAPLERCQHPNC
jgi:hypothetical protein